MDQIRQCVSLFPIIRQLFDTFISPILGRARSCKFYKKIDVEYSLFRLKFSIHPPQSQLFPIIHQHSHTFISPILESGTSLGSIIEILMPVLKLVYNPFTSLKLFLQSFFDYLINAFMRLYTPQSSFTLTMFQKCLQIVLRTIAKRKNLSNHNTKNQQKHIYFINQYVNKILFIIILGVSVTLFILQNKATMYHLKQTIQVASR